MNFRLTLILAAVLVLACTAFLLLRNPNVPEANDKAALLFNPAPEIRKIIFLKNNSRELEFAKDGDTWRITHPINATAEKNTLDDIADVLVKTEANHKYTDVTGNRSPENTGLDRPAYTVKFTDSSGKERTIAYGDRAPDGVYATLDSDKVLYVLAANPITRLDRKAEAFRTREMRQIDSDSITKLELRQKNTTITLEKSDGKWVITAPVRARANNAAVTDILNEFRVIRAQGFTTLNKKMTSLDPAESTITAYYTPKAGPGATPTTNPKEMTATLQLGPFTELQRMESSPVYASLADSNEVFTYAHDSFAKMTRDLKGLRDAAVTPTPVTGATAISVEVDGKKTVSLKKVGEWKLTSTTPELAADTFGVSDFLKAIGTLRAINFSDGAGNLASIGLDPPHMKMDLTLPGEAKSETLLMGSPQPDPTGGTVTPMMRQGEATVFLVHTADADKVKITNLSMRDRDIDRLLADHVRTIEIMGPGATIGVDPAPLKAPATATAPASAPATAPQALPQTPGIVLQRAGTQWTIQKPGSTVSVNADDAKMTSLLRAFDSLTAVEYVSENAETQGTPAVTLKVTLLEMPPPATKPAETAPATGTAPATEPLPDPGSNMGPINAKTVVYTLKLFKQDPPATTPSTAPSTQPAPAPAQPTWKAVWDHQTPAWTFKPEGRLIELATKEIYDTPPPPPPMQMPQGMPGGMEGFPGGFPGGGFPGGGG